MKRSSRAELIKAINMAPEVHLESEADESEVLEVQLESGEADLESTTHIAIASQRWSITPVTLMIYNALFIQILPIVVHVMVYLMLVLL